LPSSTGLLGVRIPDAQAALGSRRVCSKLETYFGATALVATPPPADFTQTDVGRSEVTPRNAQLPLAAPTVAMRVPGQLPLTGLPVKIETVAANPPPGICEFVPSTRSSPVLRTCSARAMLTVSVPAGGGGGGGAAPGFTVCVTAAEVLPRKSAS